MKNILLGEIPRPNNEGRGLAAALKTLLLPARKYKGEAWDQGLFKCDEISYQDWTEAVPIKRVDFKELLFGDLISACAAVKKAVARRRFSGAHRADAVPAAAVPIRHRAPLSRTLFGPNIVQPGPQTWAELDTAPLPLVVQSLTLPNHSDKPATFASQN